jgi:hypothetical protein
MIESADNAIKRKKKVSDKLSISWAEIPDLVILESRQIEKVINRVLVHLPALATIAVVEVATGTCLAHLNQTRGFDPVVAAAYSAEIVRQKQQAMVALNMRGERLEDILIPFRKQLHLIRIARNTQWFVYLVVKAQDTSLALALEVLKSVVT